MKLNTMLPAFRLSDCHWHKSAFCAALSVRLMPALLLALTVSLCATASASDDDSVSASPATVCVGDTVTVTVTCNPDETSPSADFGSEGVTLSGGDGTWTGTVTAGIAGTINVTGYNENGVLTASCSDTVVQLNDITVSGAADIGDPHYDYATMKTTSTNDFVTVTADLTPDNATAATKLTWTGGTPSTNNLLTRIHTDTTDETPVMAVCCSGSFSVDIWVISAVLKSVEFTSDHHVMTDNNSDWTDSGTLYSKPEWVADASHPSYPISQTMDTPVSVTTTVNVQPPGLPFDLTGNSSSTFLNFGTDSGISASGSDQAIDLDNPQDYLPNSVGIQSGKDISWSIDAFGGAFNCATASSSHKIYVTYGTPAGSACTEKRIQTVCGAASGKSTLGDCADAVFGSLTCNGIGGHIWGPTQNTPSDPIWLLHNTGQLSQCPGWAMFVDAHFEMLGLGAGVYKFCHANADGSYEASDSGITVYRSCVSGQHGHTDNSHAAYNNQESLVHWAGSLPNAYECTLLFNNTYYALGNGKYSSPKDVVKSTFDSIYWEYLAPNPPYDLNPCGHEIWTEQ